MKIRFLNGGFIFACVFNYILFFFISGIFVEEVVSALFAAAVLLIILYALAFTPIMDWYYRVMLHIRRPNELEYERLKCIWEMVCINAENKGIKVGDNIELFISEEKGFNAFAVAGHTIAINRELLSNYIRDDEIAGVLAHELAHLVHGDTICLIMSMQGTTVLGMVRILYMLIFWIAGKIVGFAMALALWNGNFENGIGWGKIGNYLVVKLGEVFNYFLGIVAYVETICHRFFGRKDEFAADRFSTMLGFGDGLVDFFNKLPKETKINKFSFAYLLHGTHPPMEERIERVQETMQEMQDNDVSVVDDFIGELSKGLKAETGLSEKMTKESDNTEDYLESLKENYNVDELYDIGLYCLKNRREQEGIEWLKKAAKNNHSKACTELGYCYLKGNGVDIDKKIALEYLKKACSLNDPKGTYTLAECYASLKTDKKYLDMGVKLYYKAAKLGYKDAQAKLGICFLGGIGVEKNESMAFTLLKQSAENGNYRIAGYPLAKCYIEGLGTEVDFERGEEVLERAINAQCNSLDRAKQLLAKCQKLTI